MRTYKYLEVMPAILELAGIRYFSALELCPEGRRANGNGPALQAPPAELLTNPIRTLRILDALREWTGAPLYITSGYRDPAYNKAVGSTDGSQHVRFTAFDIQSKARTPRELFNWLDRHPLAHQLGLGLYQTFVHVDYRGSRARW